MPDYPILQQNKPIGTLSVTQAGLFTVFSARAKADADRLRLAGTARRTVRQNLGWALFHNLICIPVAACGIVNPSIAAAAMTLSSNGILLHSLRLNKAEASDENRTL